MWGRPQTHGTWAGPVLTPMLPTLDPHEAAREFQACGWSLDFATEPGSADRMAVVSLLDNTVMLGVAEPPFVEPAALPHLGAGTALHCTVPADQLERIHAAHEPSGPSALERQPWGELGFQVRLAGFRFMVVAAG